MSKFWQEVKKEVKKRKIKEALPYTFLVIGIVGVFYATSLFFVGFHNFDLGMNIMKLELEFNTTLIDTTNQFTQVTGEYLYIIGTEQSRIALIVMGLSCFVIGSCITKIRESKKRK